MKEGMPHPTHYVVGPLSDLQSLYPGYNGKDVRTSTDGRSIYEIRLTEEDISVLRANSQLAVLTHAEIIDLINSEPSKWGQETDAVLFSGSELSGKTKAEIVEIAEAKGITTAGKTKSELIADIVG